MRGRKLNGCAEEVNQIQARAETFHKRLGWRWRGWGGGEEEEEKPTDGRPTDRQWPGLGARWSL